MSPIKGTVFTVGELVKRLRHLPSNTPLYFNDSNTAPLIEEEWNREGECEGVDIRPGLEHGENS